MSSKFTVEPNQNPYAPPTVRRNVPAAAGGPANARAIRLQHLRLESAIAAFGWFHMVSGVLVLLLALVELALVFLVENTEGESIAYLAGKASGRAIGGLVTLGVGMELRALKASGRIWGTIFSALTFYTGVSIWFIVLVWSGASNYVFSPEYQAVVKATPDIKRHMTATAWILIAFAVLSVALAIVLVLVLGWFIANALAEEGAEVAAGLLMGW